jgi:hypothetical protein
VCLLQHASYYKLINLHHSLDPRIGQAAGFGGVLLHGLSTFGFAARAVRETDWKQIAERVVTVAAQGVHDVTLRTVDRRDTFVGIGLALHSALQTALFALHKYEEDITTSTGPAHQGSPTDPQRWMANIPQHLFTGHLMLALNRLLKV